MIGGLTGLSSSSKLLLHTIPVILRERSSKPGENSVKASSGVNGAPAIFQALASSIEHEDTEICADTVKSAEDVFTISRTKEREFLIATLTTKSGADCEWR
ncbi:uncharacterized protein RSE6_13567 [Rhynchosporium secalis]|uniref:Uncharacterized protein n=1 Tax=Rhynchosporium secalis TaxID=38038 RepID=A0A1E1MT63_RHYSE|nr:uncharacterized protein RSE6_13567 [Rhynchosporium secalis]